MRIKPDTAVSARYADEYSRSPRPCPASSSWPSLEARRHGLDPADEPAAPRDDRAAVTEGRQAAPADALKMDLDPAVFTSTVGP